MDRVLRGGCVVDVIEGNAGADALGGMKLKAGVVARGELEKRKGSEGSSSCSHERSIINLKMNILGDSPTTLPCNKETKPASSTLFNGLFPFSARKALTV